MFGVAGPNIVKPELQAVRDLCVVSSLRGLDSTGTASFSRGKKGKYVYSISKSIYSSSEWIQTKQGHQVFDTGQGTVTLIGHCRAATIGEITHDNAHPFMAEHLIGAHNGTIHTLGKGTKTDSEELYGLIASKGIDEVVQNNVGNGAYALTWLNIKDITLNVLRNDQRSLFWCKTIGNVIFWASEAEFLALAMMRNKITIKGDIEPFKVDTLYTLPVNSTEWETREVKRKTFFTAPSTHGSKTGTSRFHIVGQGKFGPDTDFNAVYPYLDPRAPKKTTSFSEHKDKSYLMPDGTIANRTEWIDWVGCGCSLCQGKDHDLNDDVFVDATQADQTAPDFICSACFEGFREWVDMKDWRICGCVEEDSGIEDSYIMKRLAMN